MTEKVKQHAAPVTGSDEIDIGRLVGTVIEARWWVIGITAVFALCAVVYTFFATPIYSADALVQIEQNQRQFVSAGHWFGISQQTACIGRRDPVDSFASGAW